MKGVVMSEYDPAWPARFQEEAARIRQALGPISVEHMGSTAVPGLAAKPILDLMAGLARLEDGPPCVAPLEALGYECKGEFGIPGRLYFRKGDPRSHQIHMVVKGGEFWISHLRFRDLLRADPALRDEYARIKRELAARFPDDRQAYQAAKGPFIEAALKM